MYSRRRNGSSVHAGPPDWILAVVLAAGLFLWQRTTFPLWHIDLFHIQLASLAWHTDRPDQMYTSYANYDQWLNDWYRPQAERLGAWGDENAFFYPPFVAGVMAPFSDVRASVWRNTLFGLNILLLFVFASQIVRVVGNAFSWRSFLWALALVLFCYPMARASKLAQIVPLLAALFWEGLLRLKTSRFASTALIGSVIAIKVFPAGWLMLPFLRKQWRVLLGSVLVCAGIYLLSILTMGVDIHQRWWQAVQEFGSVVYTFFGNQSPAGWFTRAVLGHGILTPHFEPTSVIRIVRLLFAVFFMGGTAMLLWHSRKLSLPFALENGLVIAGVLLALPVTWEHYFLFALPAMGALIFEEWKRRRMDLQSALLAAAVFFFTMKLTRLYSDSQFGLIMSGSQCFGLLLFWLYCVKQTLAQRARPHLAGF